MKKRAMKKIEKPKKRPLVKYCGALLLAAGVILLALVGTTGMAAAQANTTTPGTGSSNCGGGATTTQQTGAGAPPAANIPCPKDSDNDCPQGKCIVTDYINPAIKALTALAGVVAVISIVLGGIQYSAAGGDPSQVSAAKSRITKTIGAFLFFLFLYAFLNWLVPGGVGN